MVKIKNIDSVDNKCFHALLVEIKNGTNPMKKIVNIYTPTYMHLPFDPAIQLLLGIHTDDTSKTV